MVSWIVKALSLFNVCNLLKPSSSRKCEGACVDASSDFTQLQASSVISVRDLVCPSHAQDLFTHTFSSTLFQYTIIQFLPDFCNYMHSLCRLLLGLGFACVVIFSFGFKTSLTFSFFSLNLNWVRATLWHVWHALTSFSVNFTMVIWDWSLHT